MVFSLLTKHQSVPLESLTLFVNRWNQGRSQLLEVSATSPFPLNFFWFWLQIRALAESSLERDWVARAHRYKCGDI
jgi:hypothetical protein